MCGIKNAGIRLNYTIMKVPIYVHKGLIAGIVWLICWIILAYYLSRKVYRMIFPNCDTFDMINYLILFIVVYYICIIIGTITRMMFITKLCGLHVSDIHFQFMIGIVNIESYDLINYNTGIKMVLISFFGIFIDALLFISFFIPWFYMGTKYNLEESNRLTQIMFVCWDAAFLPLYCHILPIMRSDLTIFLHSTSHVIILTIYKVIQAFYKNNNAPISRSEAKPEYIASSINANAVNTAVAVSMDHESKFKQENQLQQLQPSMPTCDVNVELTAIESADHGNSNEQWSDFVENTNPNGDHANSNDSNDFFSDKCDANASIPIIGKDETKSVLIVPKCTIANLHGIKPHTPLLVTFSVITVACLAIIIYLSFHLTSFWWVSVLFYSFILYEIGNITGLISTFAANKAFKQANNRYIKYIKSHPGAYGRTVYEHGWEYLNRHNQIVSPYYEFVLSKQKDVFQATLNLKNVGSDIQCGMIHEITMARILCNHFFEVVINIPEKEKINEKSFLQLKLTNYIVSSPNAIETKIWNDSNYNGNHLENDNLQLPIKLELSNNDDYSKEIDDCKNDAKNDNSLLAQDIENEKYQYTDDWFVRFEWPNNTKQCLIENEEYILKIYPYFCKKPKQNQTFHYAFFMRLFDPRKQANMNSGWVNV